MKLGVIIVFDSCENEAFEERFLDLVRDFKQINYCFVINNNGRDSLEILNDIAEQSENTSVLEINGSKSEVSAVRAGARYLSSHLNLGQIGFITNIHGDKLLELIHHLTENRDIVFNIVSKQQKNKKVKQTLFQRLFSISECLSDLGIDV